MAYETQIWLDSANDPRYNYFQHTSSLAWSSQPAISNATFLTQQYFPHSQPYTYPAHCGDSGSDLRLYEHDQPVRYTSPSNTYSSGISELSASSGSSFLSLGFHSQIHCTTSPIERSDDQMLGQFIQTAAAYDTSWHTSGYSTTPKLLPQSIVHQLLPVQHTLPAAKYERSDGRKDSHVEIFEHDAFRYTTHLPQQIPEPEEVDLPEVSSDISTRHKAKPHAKKRVAAEMDSEVELETEIEEDTTDHESDPDFTTKPERRRTSRGSTSRTIRSSVSKRSASNAAPPKSGPMGLKRHDSTAMSPPTTSKHIRRLSKSKAKLKKGPVFAQKSSVITISKAERSYPCAFHHFGCNAEFPNKNEWKRHVACQHLQLGFYRCDLGDCDPDNQPTPISLQGRRARQNSATCADQADQDETSKNYNDFNRKDLFTQHARRMHGPTRDPNLCSNAVPPSHVKKTSNYPVLLYPTKEEKDLFESSLEQIRRRCWKVRRKAPARSICGFCPQVFDADNFDASMGKSASGGTMSQGPAERRGAEEKAWEERMEHLGRHYERMGSRKEDEERDEDLEQWGLDTGVLRRLENNVVWLANVVEPGEKVKTEITGLAERGGRRKARRQSQPVDVVVQKVSGSRKTKVKAESESESRGNPDEDAYGESE